MAASSMTGGTTPTVLRGRRIAQSRLFWQTRESIPHPQELTSEGGARALHLIQISFSFKRLQSHAFGLLKRLGLVDDARTDAKAFARLQNKLFRLYGVEGVAVQGFAESPNRPTSRSGANVLVITSQSPDGLLQQDVSRIVSETNDRYGTGLKASIVDWKSFDSSLRSYPTC